MSGIDDILRTLRLIVMYDKDDPSSPNELSNFLTGLSVRVDEGEEWDEGAYESFREAFLEWADRKREDTDYLLWKNALDWGKDIWKDKKKHWWWYVL